MRANVRRETDRSALSQFQAALTHGHPTGLAASDLAAYAVLLLARGTEPAGLLGRSRADVADRRAAHHEDRLGYLWAYSPDPSSAHSTARGWDGGPGRTLGQRYRRQRYRRR